MAKLSDRGQGNLLGFLNNLAAVVTKRKQTVLVVTDPADRRIYAKESSKIGDSLIAAAIKLDDMFGRKMTDFDPIGGEAARVIGRRPPNPLRPPIMPCMNESPRNPLGRSPPALRA
jgi:hypothetical protein